MFLNKLNSEEKVAFLKLAHHVARSDGEFLEREQSTIDTYCFEMQIDDISYSEAEFNLEKVLTVFANKESQRILLLELMALIYSDGAMQQEEEEILDIVVERFDINPILIQMYAEWTKTILSVAMQGKLLLEL